MGASLVYLDEPNKNIEWAEGEDNRATFACGEMQGWRLNMVSVQQIVKTEWLEHWKNEFYESLQCHKVFTTYGMSLFLEDFPYDVFIFDDLRRINHSGSFDISRRMQRSTIRTLIRTGTCLPCLMAMVVEKSPNTPRLTLKTC